eukprot:766145-Hanusia_phi.AAC.4
MENQSRRGENVLPLWICPYYATTTKTIPLDTCSLGLDATAKDLEITIKTSYHVMLVLHGEGKAIYSSYTVSAMFKGRQSLSLHRHACMAGPNPAATSSGLKGANAGFPAGLSASPLLAAGVACKI